MEAVTRHIRWVGILHILLNALNALGGLVLILLGVAGGALMSTEGLPGWAVGGVAVVLGAALLIPSLPGLLGGIGLLGLRAWARWVIVVVSVINLFHPAFPIGTAISVYSLWALLNQRAELAFQMAGVSPSS